MRTWVLIIEFTTGSSVAISGYASVTDAAQAGNEAYEQRTVERFFIVPGPRATQTDAGQQETGR